MKAKKKRKLVLSVFQYTRQDYKKLKALQKEIERIPFLITSKTGE